MTRAEWDVSHSSGNTLANIFRGYDKNKIANLYLRSSLPKNDVCNRYFSISEKSLLKSIFAKNHKPGLDFIIQDVENNDKKINNSKVINEKKIYGFFRKRKSIIAYWLQDLLWRFGKWNNTNLDNFLQDFQPDIIFSFSYYTRFSHRILWDLKRKTGAKLVLFHADDYLIMPGVRKTPLKLINKRLIQRTVEASIKKADLNYCISNLQCEKYNHVTGEEMKHLQKGGDFSGCPNISPKLNNDTINLVYIGSILHGRWRTLYNLGKIIDELNKDLNNDIFRLNIYSQFELTKTIKNLFGATKAIRFRGEIPADLVFKTIQENDIVLHVESFDPKEKLKTQLSFSTKIIDLLQSGRCIMAIGWEHAASISFFKENSLGLVASSDYEIKEQLKAILKEPSKIVNYPQKAWQYGKSNHEIAAVQRKLFSDFRDMIGEDLNEDSPN